MSSILTITLNPAIDKSSSVESLIHEKKLNCTRPKFEPGGGGINVSRAIKKLGGTSRAFYLAGGYTGKFFTEMLEKEDIDAECVEIKNHTRENLIIYDKSTGLQYRFGMPGPLIYDNEWKTLLSEIESVSNVEYLVASGSISEGIPEDIFARIAHIAKRKKIKCIVDTSGSALSMAVKENLFLIKPNLGELNALADEKITVDNISSIADELDLKNNCENIVVSMGAEGAFFIGKNEKILFTPPAVERKSTVGAGDSMVAGIVLSLANGKNIMNAVKYGVASGTAATLNPGTELCHLEDVENLFQKIK
ncbi:MAG: 1-phosphofructokinase family hexose kinase [Ferruginibacter sp.]|nr:1-phosphofructokinase family hexose kinase [Ferruginibacter sp.]